MVSLHGSDKKSRWIPLPHSRPLTFEQVLPERSLCHGVTFPPCLPYPQRYMEDRNRCMEQLSQRFPTSVRSSPYHLYHPFGQWRYTRTPQGFLSSGDGYNRRFDAILSSFERKERCVDDTIHYDQTLTQHWWRTIDLLTRLGQAGVVLNPDKFQFAERSVDFAVFRVSNATIEPLPKYLDAICEFPSPTSTTDIQSWFGLVNHVSNYAQLRDLMAPFKPFLSPRCKFVWTAEQEDAFQASKDRASLWLVSVS